MSEKKAKAERKQQQANLTVITAHIYRTPTGMNAIVQGVPANFDYAMACAGLISKTMASYHVKAAERGQAEPMPAGSKEVAGS